MKLLFSFLLALSIISTSLQTKPHHWLFPATATASLVTGAYYCMEAEALSVNGYEHAALTSSTKGLFLLLYPCGYFSHFILNDSHNTIEKNNSLKRFYQD